MSYSFSHTYIFHFNEMDYKYVTVFHYIMDDKLELTELNFATADVASQAYDFSTTIVIS